RVDILVFDGPRRSEPSLDGERSSGISRSPSLAPSVVPEKKPRLEQRASARRASPVARRLPRVRCFVALRLGRPPLPEGAGSGSVGRCCSKTTALLRGAGAAQTTS